MVKAQVPVGGRGKAGGIRKCNSRDEVAAATWLDEPLVTRFDDYFIDVNLHRGASYGDMLSWDPGHEPGHGERRARIQKHLDDARFYEAFVALCSVQP